MLMPWRYNALLSGDATARTMGINVDALRFASLLLASMITAVCVSYLGIIGFVGIICPHVTKRLLGEDHRYSTPASILSGSPSPADGGHAFTEYGRRLGAPGRQP